MRRMRNLRRGARSLVFGLIIIAVASMSATAGAGTGAAGGVMPPAAQPHGVSRTDMTEALALFSISGNDPALLPDTPAQVLYADPATISFTPDGTGLLQTGSNAFTVRAGTSFFVPVFNVDDSPPVIGDFPTTNAEAQNYFFDPAQLGGQDFQIVIDGVTTPLGAGYVAGPVTTPPLPDGGGTHIVTLGAFLHPMAPGIHTVTISGGVFGAALLPAIGISFLRESFTYQIDVER